MSFPLVPPVVFLAHGAGSHSEFPHILRLAHWLSQAGFEVRRFNFPYRKAGRKIPDRMPVLTEAYQAEVKAWLASFPSSSKPPPFYLAGHSMGCRVAIQVALRRKDCQGLFLFSYPLIGAGKNKEPRLVGLDQISSHALTFSGNRDALCPLDLWQKILQELPLFTLHVLNHGDHSLAVPAKIKRASGQDPFEAEVIQALRQFKEI